MFKLIGITAELSEDCGQGGAAKARSGVGEEQLPALERDAPARLQAEVARFIRYKTATLPPSQLMRNGR